MAKTKISEFSATPANNTDIDSINIAEGCAPSGINDAIRELMAQLKDFQTGAVGDSFNGPVGTTTAAAGAFTTLSASSTVSGTGFSTYLASPPAIGGTAAAAGSFTTLSASGNVTISGGTANGVAYLNGSKVVTSGSALTFSGSAFAVNSTTAGVGINDTTASVGVSFSWLNGGASYSYGQLGLRDTTNSQTAYTYFAGASGYHNWYQNGTEQMRLTSTGLGIGTSSPSVKLDVYGSDPRIQSYNSGGPKNILLAGGSVGYTGMTTNHPLVFLTNDTERLRIDTSGNRGLGVTPSAWASGVRAFQNGAGALYTINTVQQRLSLNAYRDSSGTMRYINSSINANEFRMGEGDGSFQWFTAPSGTAGNAITFTQALTLDASGNLLLGQTSGSGTFSRTLDIQGSSSSGINLTCGGAYSGAGISVDASANLVFRNAGSERARIDSSGRFMLGTTSALNSGGAKASIQFAGGQGLFIATEAQGNGQVMGFNYNISTNVGSISITSTATAYNTSSDQRLKENIADANSASTLIDALQVRKFDWKADGSHQRYGFVAQELATVAPEAVYQPEDTEQMMAVDYSKLVPMLVKEIQSLRKRLADAGIA